MALPWRSNATTISSGICTISVRREVETTRPNWKRSFAIIRPFPSSFNHSSFFAITIDDIIIPFNDSECARGVIENTKKQVGLTTIDSLQLKIRSRVFTMKLECLTLLIKSSPSKEQKQKGESNGPHTHRSTSISLLLEEEARVTHKRQRLESQEQSEKNPATTKCYV